MQASDGKVNARIPSVCCERERRVRGSGDRRRRRIEKGSWEWEPRLPGNRRRRDESPRLFVLRRGRQGRKRSVHSRDQDWHRQIPGYLDPGSGQPNKLLRRLCVRGCGYDRLLRQLSPARFRRKTNFLEWRYVRHFLTKVIVNDRVRPGQFIVRRFFRVSAIGGD